MLSSITPLGERGRRRRWSVTAAWYLLGTALGGILTGTLAGGVGWLALWWWEPTRLAQAIVIASLAAGGIALDVRGGRGIPTVHRQVNEDWLDLYRAWVYGAGFGFQLGMGVVTIVTTAAVYVTFAIAFLAADPVIGAVIGGIFGVARGVPIVAVRRVDSPADLLRFHERMQQWAPRARVLPVVGLSVAILIVVVSW